MRPTLIAAGVLTLMSTGCGSSKPTSSSTGQTTTSSSAAAGTTSSGGRTSTTGATATGSSSSTSSGSSTSTGASSGSSGSLSGSSGSSGSGSLGSTGGNGSSSGSGSTGAGSGSSSGSGGTSSTSYPAPFPAPPQVQDYGGPVLGSPKLVPVFFSDDDPTLVAQLSDFLSQVGSTQYWAAATTEYGVGAAMSLQPIQLAEVSPTTIDDSAIQTWLLGKLNSNDPAWPPNDANTVYVLHYPASTTITSGGQSSCTAFGGYHSNTTLDAAHGSADVAYAVIPRCNSFGNFTGIDAVTGVESHELIEAATDPYPMTQPAYAGIDDAHVYWIRALGGGEVGDLCAQFTGAFTKFAELPQYLVQRTWSNASAVAGHDPCVPALPGEVYFNAAPVLPDTIPLSVFGQQVNSLGVTIPVGSSKTIELDLFSDGPTSGPWTVDAKDLSAVFGGTAYLSLSVNPTTGLNGQKLQLTITVNSAGRHNYETFMVTSKLNGQTNLWFGLVGN